MEKPFLERGNERQNQEIDYGFGLAAAGTWLAEFFCEKKFGDYLGMLAGAFILTLGIIIGLGKDFDSYLCKIIHRFSFEGDL